MVNRRKIWCILIVLVLGLASGLNVSAGGSMVSEATYELFLPVIKHNAPSPPSVFGVQFYSFNYPLVINMAGDAKVSWARVLAFDWSKIEPSPPTFGVHSYDWSSVSEESLINLAKNDMYTIAIVYKAPTWAQKYPGVYCGPIAETKLPDFAAFIYAVVSRYSRAPYDIHYWELGNEPDIDAQGYDPNSDFGCWGDKNNPYYGGEYYALMLKYAYPAIKSADPQSMVLNGGLLLDCDPIDDDCADPRPSYFFEGILRAGGGNYFDIVSYHGYSFYSQGGESNNKWDMRGGADIGKAKFLRQVMAQYGYDKPLMNTEASLLCPEWNIDCNPPGDAFFDAQADYVVKTYVRTWVYDLLGSIWYPFHGPGWRYSDLIGDSIVEPKPAYYAYLTTANILNGVDYHTKLTNLAPLEAYEFVGRWKKVWVLWSADGSPVHFNVPMDVDGIYDKYGDDVSVPGDRIIHVNSPVFVVFK